MTSSFPTSAESPPQDDIARQRDEVVKRMLATPPQPKRTKPVKKT